MAGKKIDMLNGSLWDKILFYAIPLAVTGILQQLFNAADLAVVGQFRGPHAMAAVGSNAPVISLLINFFIGISLGTNVVLANAIGAKDESRIRKCVHTSIYTSARCGVLLTIFGEIFAGYILSIMGVPEECLKLATLYLRIYLLGMPVILLYNFEAAIYRAIGDTKTPLFALLISGITNVILNVALVCGAGMSVDGVAIATVTSNIISSLYLLNGLAKSDSDVHVDFGQLKITKPTLIRILRIGIPAGIQSMMFALSNLVIQSSINRLGATVMAGSAAALNVEIFAFFVLSSFGQTCTTFVGQNNGAHKYDRCRKSMYICMGYSYLFTSIAATLMLIYYKELLGLFCKDPEVIEIGYIRLYWLAFAFIFSILQDILSGLLRGFGQSLGPALISLIGICGIRIVWVCTIFKKSPTFTTVMQSYPVSLSITAFAIAILCMILKKKGKLGK
jgi:putative MATE family efflux protein